MLVAYYIRRDRDDVTGDRETYIEDPAGEFRVFAASCEWDSELGEWVPDAGGTETEILNMLD